MTAVALLALQNAAASSLIVFPLEQDEGSEKHRGLGFALADLVERDLSQMPGIDIESPPSLLASVELSKRDGVSPEDAAQSATDLGVELALRGSWRVHDQTLDLSFELVEAPSGRVVARAAGSGASGDFVTVQKEAVLALVDDMGVQVSPGIRRRVLGDVPTESFEALVEYGQGRRASATGDTDAALAHFDSAAQLDPGFDLAIRRSSQERMRQEHDTLDRSAEASETRTAMLERALQKSPDEMQISKRTKSVDDLARLLLRFSILDDQRQHCQAAREMRHMLVRNDGRFVEAEPHYLRSAVASAALKWGLGGKLARTEADILDDIPDVVARIPSGSPWEFVAANERHRVTLLHMTLECAGPRPEARLAALESLLATVKGLKPMPPPRNGGAPIDVELRLRIARERAMISGATAELAAELEAIEGVQLDVRGRERIEAYDARTRELATAQTRFLRGIAPFTPVGMRELARSLAGTHGGSDLCEAVADGRDWALLAEEIDALMIDDEVPVRDRGTFARLAILPRTARVLGCLETPAIVDDVHEARTWVNAILATSEGCEGRDAHVREMLEGEPDPEPRGTVRLVKAAVASLLVPACADEPTDLSKQNSDSPVNPGPEPIREP
ncbi:MAG: hypothetical protein H6737_10925 [Alphaproteobacteria bacterium]|nr:hypothetical protein [Alphaproteobacteria bacterium]